MTFPAAILALVGGRPVDTSTLTADELALLWQLREALRDRDARVSKPHLTRLERVRAVLESP